MSCEPYCLAWNSGRAPAVLTDISARVRQLPGLSGITDKEVAEVLWVLGDQHAQESLTVPLPPSRDAAGKVLRRARKARGNQAPVARSIGITPNQMSAFETGKPCCSPAVAARIYLHFGISPWIWFAEAPST